MSNIAVIGSIVSSLTKGQSANSTDAAFSVNDTKPTTTEPVASSTKTVIKQGGTPYKDGVTLKVTPYGGNDNGDLVNIKVTGWNSIPSATGLPLVEYISHHVCEVQGRLSSALPGVAGMTISATEFFCDLLTLTSGFAVLHNGAAAVDVAWFECDVSSYQYVTVKYSKGAGGDQMNCLYRF